MWSFIKGLLLIKDRPIAKEMVEEDQSIHLRTRKKTKRFNFSRRFKRRENLARMQSPELKLRFYEIILQILRIKK